MKFDLNSIKNSITGGEETKPRRSNPLFYVMGGIYLIYLAKSLLEHVVKDRGAEGWTGEMITCLVGGIAFAGISLFFFWCAYKRKKEEKREQEEFEKKLMSDKNPE